MVCIHQHHPLAHPPPPKAATGTSSTGGNGWMDGWGDVFEKRETDDQARKDGWTFSEIDISGTRRAGKFGRECVVGE